MKLISDPLWDKIVSALAGAEDFMAGFEDDEAQEDMSALEEVRDVFEILKANGLIKQEAQDGNP